MKTRAKKMAVPAIIAALTASLAPVPAASATPLIPVVGMHHDDRMVSHLSFDLTEGLLFLPLPEATAYLQGITSHMRQLQAEMLSNWEARGGGRLLVKEAKMRKALEESIAHSNSIREAIRIVIAEKNLIEKFSDSDIRAAFKADLITFGRAVSNNQYTAEDIISQMEQARPPRATSTPPQPTAEEVKAMITAEHKSLGISAPKWG